jgi:hypothetical protein
MHSLVMSSASPFLTLPQVSHDSPLHLSFPINLCPQLPTIPARVTMANSPLNHHFPTSLNTTQTPFFAIDERLHYLPPQILSQINQAIQNSWSKSTVYRYSGAICQFISFCNSLHIPQHLCFPANKLVLCAFAASSTGKHAGSMPHACLSALKACHTAHNLEWKGSTWLCQVLRGMRNLAPSTLRHRPWLPITALMLF